MLHADSNVVAINMIRVVTLKSLGLGHGHLGVEIRILAETLPLTRPDRIAAKVHHGREDPRHHSSAGLVSHRPAHRPGMFPIECRGKVYLLREQGAVRQVARAVNHVQTVQAWNADLLHRFFLDFVYEARRLLMGARHISKSVQDGSHFHLADDFPEFFRV